MHASGQSREELFRRDSAALVTELQMMLKSDQQYRSGSRRAYRKNYEAARALDSQNTRRMMEIIGTYGFPSLARFADAPEGFLPFGILLHAPNTLADTVKALLTEEKAAGRICVNEHAYVLWHLAGRDGSP